jgi:hypothetical protein
MSLMKREIRLIRVTATNVFRPYTRREKADDSQKGRKEVGLHDELLVQEYWYHLWHSSAMRALTLVVLIHMDCSTG